MNKTLKVVLTALVSFVILFGFVQTTSLAGRPDVGGVLNNVEAQNASEDAVSSASEIGGTVVNTIWGISIVVTVVVLTYTGLKFVIGSAQEKAEYKKSLIPLVVGVLIMVFATTIVKVVFSVG